MNRIDAHGSKFHDEALGRFHVYFKMNLRITTRFSVSSSWSDRDSLDNVSSYGLVAAVVESGRSGISVAGQVLAVFQRDALTQQICYRSNPERMRG